MRCPLPILFIPLGHPSDRDGIYPLFSSMKSFDSITKYIEHINAPDRVVETMRRAFAALKRGRPGPVMVEIPADIAIAEVDPSLVESYQSPKEARASGNDQDILDAAKRLLDAAFLRAKKVTEDGRAALLEFLTNEEQAFSHRRAF